MSEQSSAVDYQLSLVDDDTAWQVFRVWIGEAINRPYRATIDVVTKTTEVDTEALLGAGATLTLTRAGGELQCVHGIVLQVDYLGFAEHGLCVRFHLVPAFELLHQRVGSRIWQETSVQDIAAAVLGDALGDYDRTFDPGETQRGATPRDYCVQYCESDLDYVTRLLEEEGLSYVFEHSPDVGHEVLALRDDNGQYPVIADPAEFQIIIHNPDELEFESIQSFEWMRALTGTASLRRDFDWKTPAQLLTAAADGADGRGRVRRSYAHGSRRFITDDQAQQASDMQKAAALMGAVAKGRSNATVLRPGYKFKIAEHERSDLVDREYIVTEVIHTGHVAGVAPSLGYDGPHYANEFVCVPADVEIRPPRLTPKPYVRGPQTAVVTGDDEIHTDEHGRIQVQFHWEEEPSNAAGSSCWVRCAQSWAAFGWGAQFIPRVGMEVVVEFLEGNPDRPLVVGCVYNGDNPPPFTVPGSKTQSGWRTNSSPGGGGSNELRFEDAAGSEEIYIHGQKDWRIEIDNDKSHTIGHDVTGSIGNNETSTVGNDQSLKVGNNQSLTVGNNQTNSIGHDQIETIGNNQTLSVGQAQQVTIGTDCTQSIGASHTQTISSNKIVAVGQLFGLVVGAGYNIAVAAEMGVGVGGALVTTVGGMSSETVVGGKTVSARSIAMTAVKGIALTAKGTCTLDSGQDMIVTSKKNLSVKADDSVAVKGGKDGMIEFAKSLVLKCGDASITLKKNGDIVLKGKNISVSGSGDIKIKGKKITNN